MNNVISFRLWEELETHLDQAVVEYNESSDGKWSRSDIINLSIQYFYRLVVKRKSRKDLTAMLSIIYSAIENNLDDLYIDDLYSLHNFLTKKLKEKSVDDRRKKIDQGFNT